MLWNDFPKYIHKSLLKNIFKEVPKQEKNIVNKNNISTIWIQLPHIGIKGKNLMKQCIRKVKRNCTTDIKFVILHNTKKISYYCTVKDKVPTAQRSSVTYQVVYVMLGILVITCNFRPCNILRQWFYDFICMSKMLNNAEI